VSANVRSSAALVTSYSSPALDGVDLDLRDNTNPWGSPPTAVRVFAELANRSPELALYPSVNGESLVAAIAAHIGVSESSVVVGCGSDDLLDASFRAFARHGDSVAHSDPTFSMIPRFARLNGIESRVISLRGDGSADVDALLAADSRLAYVASPNNPTGTITDRAELVRLIDAHAGVVLIDEAYAEFSTADDLRAFATTRTNVVVFRTFSKAWGLAGLRCGYAVASAALAAELTAARGPYRVTSLAQEVVGAALRSDAAWVAARARDTVAVRTALESALSRPRSVSVIPSSGNFVFARVTEPAVEVAARFEARGIGVRAFQSLTGYGDAVRIGVTTEANLDRLLRAIHEVFA
jgi:histidinol-phosphate aminotransferase